MDKNNNLPNEPSVLVQVMKVAGRALSWRPPFRITLVESMIIVAIVGILAALVIPQFAERKKRSQTEGFNKCADEVLMRNGINAGAYSCKLVDELGETVVSLSASSVKKQYDLANGKIETVINGVNQQPKKVDALDSSDRDRGIFSGLKTCLDNHRRGMLQP